MQYISQLICQRQGCRRPVKGDFTECSLGCRFLRNELESAANLSSACGPTEATDAYLLGVRNLVVVFDDCQKARRQIHEAAKSVGIDGAAWGAMVRGDNQALRERALGQSSQ
jgi:hypothetical protein